MASYPEPSAQHQVDRLALTDMVLSGRWRLHSFDFDAARQIPPFAAVYTREPSGVRQRSVGGDPLRKNCSDRVRR